MHLAVYHNLPSGGAKRSLFEMVRGLSQKHQIDVYTLSTSDQNFSDIRPFCQHHKVFPITPARMFNSPLGRLNQGMRLITVLRAMDIQKLVAREIDGQKYDAVFVTNCIIGQSPAVLPFLKTPSVFYSHEPPRFLYDPVIPRPYTVESRLRKTLDRIDPLLALYKRIYISIDRKNVLAANRVLVNSSFSQVNFARIYGENAQVCYPGVDIDLFQPLNLPESDYVLSVGAIHPPKGFDFLIQSLASIPRSGRPKLRLISNMENRPEVEYLQNMARECQVSLDIFSGLANRALVEAYNQALLTVYSPVREPFGFVPLESMACEKAVVGVAEGGVCESVISGKTGLLVNRNPAEFADAVQTLISDPDRRKEFGKLGRMEVKENWQWLKCVRTIESTLEEIAGKI